jgi:hypothetical protein
MALSLSDSFRILEKSVVIRKNIFDTYEHWKQNRDKKRVKKKALEREREEENIIMHRVKNLCFVIHHDLQRTR